MLITSRDERLAKRLAGRHASIVVDHMSLEEAQDLLEKWQADPSDSSSSDTSKSLLEALGYIPLAITQAAAFINENYITPLQYLDMFHQSDFNVQDLLDEDLGDHRRDTQSHNSIIKTWKMSFDLISQQKPRAAEMLSLMAVLDRQGIPESLLRQDTDRSTDFITALGTLQAFALVSAGANGAGYEIHRLVQLATWRWLEIQGTIGMWQEKALLVVAGIFPDGVYENWSICESLLPHAQKLFQYGVVNEKNPLDFSELLSNVAIFDLQQGHYDIACTRYLAAIELQKKTLGIDHQSTMINMNNLALAYRQQGRFKEAEQLQTQVLERLERVSGAEHLDTLTYKNNLAATYQDLNRWEDADREAKCASNRGQKKSAKTGSSGYAHKHA